MKSKYCVKNYGSINSTLYVLCLILILLTSCKKEISGNLPGNEEDASLNFYNASDVMETAYGPAKASVAFYVNKYQEQLKPISAESGNKFPYFSFGFTDGHDYPSSNNGGINYIRYNAGTHRLLLTDVTNAIVLDASVAAKPNSFSTIYLADKAVSQGSAAAYQLVNADEDNQTTPGKMGVRFIHLSADAGDITCNLQKSNGDLTGTQAGELAFGEVSGYQYFGTDETAAGGLLRFTLSNTANAIKFSTGVAFEPGRNYVILIMGFRSNQQRLVATGKNTDGSVKNELITISSNLRAEARRSY